MITISSKAKLLIKLREKQGLPISGSLLAKDLGISRVAVWKTVQSLMEAGYLIETIEKGYLLKPENEKDFLYPWEFSEKESFFYHYLNTGSTMDRAKELANRGIEKAVITADKQTSGKGRNGRTWVSKKGGLFFSILERPNLTIADYTLYSLMLQIAVVKSITYFCGKKVFLRWPNDIYINNQKIAGVTTEVCGEGDLISWISGGIGVNINNKPPSVKATNMTDIGCHVTRKEMMNKILDEINIVKNKFQSSAFYSQGNRPLTNEWNSLSDCIGAKAVVFEPENKEDNSIDKPCKIFARGIFKGIDPIGRCILKTNTDKGDLYFNQGSVSFAVLNT